MNEMICPHCGTKSTAGSPDSPQVCPHCGNPLKKANLVTCPDCGHEVSKNANSCPSCGCLLKRKMKLYYASKLRRGLSGVSIFVGIFLLFFALFSPLWWLLLLFAVILIGGGFLFDSKLKMECPCGYVGTPKRISGPSTLITVFLLFIGFLPAIIYLLLVRTKYECPNCQREAVRNC